MDDNKPDFLAWMRNIMFGNNQTLHLSLKFCPVYERWYDSGMVVVIWPSFAALRPGRLVITDSYSYELFSCTSKFYKKMWKVTIPELKLNKTAGHAARQRP